MVGRQVGEHAHLHTTTVRERRAGIGNRQGLVETVGFDDGIAAELS
jgi:hypothetical protein